jgi:hypothetical protein
MNAPKGNFGKLTLNICPNLAISSSNHNSIQFSSAYKIIKRWREMKEWYKDFNRVQRMKDVYVFGTYNHAYAYSDYVDFTKSSINKK